MGGEGRDRERLFRSESRDAKLSPRRSPSQNIKQSGASGFVQNARRGGRDPTLPSHPLRMGALSQGTQKLTFPQKEGSAGGQCFPTKQVVLPQRGCS